MTEVRMEWQEQVRQEDTTHQLEPGEVRMRTRNGLVQQYVWTTDHLASGKVDGKLQAVLLDDSDPTKPQVVMHPLTKLRVMPLGHGGRCIPLALPPGTKQVEVTPDRMLAKGVVGRLVPASNYQLEEAAKVRWVSESSGEANNCEQDEGA